MMKMKLSKIVLITSVVGTLLVYIFLVNIYKTDLVINDVCGNREELGNMNILLQKTSGVFKTEDIFIDKNNVNIENLSSQGNGLVNLTKENINNRDLFKFEYDENSLFEDENSIGIATTNEYTIINNKPKMIASIKIKDKKSGKIEAFEIDMGDGIDTSRNYKFEVLPVKKEGNILYMAVMYSNYGYSDFKAKDCKSTSLTLYKLNLSNKTSKCIISKDYQADDLSVKQSAFSNNHKAYFIVNKKHDKLNQYTSNLFEFDIKSKEVNLINLGSEDDYIGRACTIENNEILLVSVPGEYENNYLVGKDVEGILVDLKNRKLKYTYKLDMNYNVGYDKTNIIRISDGKIYALSLRYSNSNKYRENNPISYNIYVFDEKNGEKLYEGNTNINSNYRINMGLVKKDEI